MTSSTWQDDVGRAGDDLAVVLDARDVDLAQAVRVELAQPLALQVGVDHPELLLAQAGPLGRPGCCASRARRRRRCGGAASGSSGISSVTPTMLNG